MATMSMLGALTVRYSFEGIARAKLQNSLHASYALAGLCFVWSCALYGERVCYILRGNSVHGTPDLYRGKRRTTTRAN